MSKAHRVLFITDLHLRSDYIPGFLEKQVKTLLALVNKKPPDSLIIGGDVFHRRNPGGDELLAFDTLLDKFKCKNIYVLRGNHDTIHKDGTSDTTLSLFKEKAHIIKDTATFRIGSVDFDFVPHYESEEKIVSEVKKCKHHLVGHFGFDGCISNGSYSMDAKLKRWHFPKGKFIFLGHIHKPKVYDKRIHILGTPYSNSFGESNAQKFITELVIREGNVQVFRKPIDFGIRHVCCSVDELEKKSKQLNFGNFFTVLRLQLDRMDEYVERQLNEKLTKTYDVDYLEMSFEDILPKFTSEYTPDRKLFSLDEDIISSYVDSRNSIFEKKDLMDTLKMIKDED
jgi:DNA repair exonuclease SbcCD nuclease subunit